MHFITEGLYFYQLLLIPLTPQPQALLSISSTLSVLPLYMYASILCLTLGKRTIWKRAGFWE